MYSLDTISQEAGQVVWYSHVLKNFPQFVVIHTVKGFGVVNKAEVDVCLELFFQWSNGCWQFYLCSSAFPKSEHLEVHHSCTVEAWPGKFWALLASMWDEYNCAIVWTFFGITFLWDGNQTDLFQSCSHCWVFQISGILSAALSQHHLLGFDTAQLEFHHFH